MDWLTFVVTAIKALAWPAVVIVVAFVLKRNLGDLLRSLGNRLEKAKGGGFELTFGKAIDQVEEALPGPEVKEVSAAISPRKIEAVLELSQLPPAYIISQAWLQLEQTIRATADMPTQHPAGRRSFAPMEYIQLAKRQGLLEDDEIPAIEQLRQLRNQAAHSVDPGISITDALRYYDIAEALIEKIRQRSRSTRGRTAPSVFPKTTRAFCPSRYNRAPRCCN